MFDTGATYYFCNKNLYTEFKPLYDAVAVNSATFPIEGSGIVDLKMGGEIVQFEEVTHSPKLRKNPISGSILDFKGGGGSVKVSNQDDKTLI